MFKNCSCQIPNAAPEADDHGVKASACKPCSAKSMLLMLGGLVLAGVVLTAIASVAWSAPGDPPRSDVALEGYCPVCVINAGKWIRGDARYQVVYDGQIYYFPSDEQRQVFLADPVKYVPALGSDCTVCYAKMQKRVPGNIRHAVRHDGRLYLFPSDQEKQAFLANPAEFVDVDLALGGNCAVCKAMAGKEVPGKPEFAAIHHGLRYLFPSDRERQAFLAEPAKYAAAKPAGETLRAASVTTNAVSVIGRSGCAACEHGVTPLGAPDELGLAVNTPDGKVYVIEDAHRLYPQVYKDRFSHVQLKVSGEILKQRGKTTWLKPTELAVIN